MRRLGELTQRPALLMVVFAALFVLSGLITFLAMRPRLEPRVDVARPGYNPDAVEAIPEYHTPDPPILSDFILLEEYDVLSGSNYYFYREDRDSWSQAEVQRFWVPIESIVTDILARQNDRNIDELFR